MISPSEDDETSTARRILIAATRQIASSGAAALSMSDIAREANVSKALILYHFKDKDTLLARLVEQLVQDLVVRERAALARYEGQHNPLVVDALWEWLNGELQRGDIRALLELDSCRGSLVQAAARRAALLRRETTKDTVDRLFGILELQPRIDAALLANVFVAFVDGLAIDAFSQDVSSSARVAFDVFWLAMLSLAQ
ncbi:MAG TPA: TetR/AcrR family transcriptional regulator [Gemmatimonadaceae bacterium]|nr:TetR/AcrR family transcriptional regulator [Gemmatimonadaceae bacterium]